MRFGPLLLAAAQAPCVHGALAAPATRVPAGARAEAVAPPASSPWFISLERGVGGAAPDGTFAAALHFVTQLRLEEVVAPGGRQTPEFHVVLARPAVRGHALRPWIQYFVQAELAGSPALLDAELTVQPWPFFGVKLGQFVTPFSREFLVPPFRLLFPEFAPSNVFFRDGRETGAMVFGTVAGGRFAYFTGLFNGNGINQPPGKAHLKWIGRLAYNPTGRAVYDEVPQLVAPRPTVSIGVSGSFGVHDRPAPSGIPTGSPPPAEDVAKIGGDMVASFGPGSISAEGYARWSGAAGTPATWAAGGFVQVAVFVWQRRLQVAARGDVIAPDVRTSDGLRSQGAAQLAWYARAHHLKLQLRYAYTDVRATATAIATRTHALALQAQLQF